MVLEVVVVASLIDVDEIQDAQGYLQYADYEQLGRQHQRVIVQGLLGCRNLLHPRCIVKRIRQIAFAIHLN
jgi:hypothetical protein